MYREDRDKGLKYVIYARRSIKANRTEEDAGVPSILSQLNEVHELASKYGLKVVKEFTETVSASEPRQRPEFTAMMRYIEEGKANAILCFKIDRLSRNSIDEGEIKHFLQKEIIKNIKATDRDLYPDDHTIMWSVEMSSSTQYSRDLKKHIRRGQKDALRRGFRPCLAPIGYKNTKFREKGKPEVCEVDEHNAVLIKKIFDAVLSRKYTPFQVYMLSVKEWGMRARKTVRNPNGRPLSIHGFYNILNNSFYYGEFTWSVRRGDKDVEIITYQGTHTPLITRAQFDEVQRLLGKKGKPRSTVHVHAYTGLMRCGACGARITCEKKTKTQQNGNYHEYSYYRCTGKIKSDCKQKSITGKQLEVVFADFLSSIQIDARFHEWAMAELKNEYEKESNDKDSILYKQERALKATQQQLTTLFEMRLASEIEGDEYKERRATLEAEERRLKVEIESVDQRFKTWIDDAERLMTFAERASEEFAKGGVLERRAIIAALGDEHVLDQGILTMNTEKPVQVLLEASSLGVWLEPLENQEEYTQKGTFVPNHETMWRCGELNSGPNLALRASLRRVASIEVSV
jgi:site-specific DNA recombinase